MKHSRIAVVGSLNMDLVVSMRKMPRIGETVHGDALHTIPGGKGANQAVGCAKLGAHVSMIGAVGQDAFGDVLLAQLEQHGIHTEAVVRMEGTTGTATIMHTPEDNCIVVVPGANGRVTPELVTRHAALIQEADVLLVQLEIPLEAVQAALQIARSAGVPAVLNPAPAVKLPQALLQLADFITPNETEFELLSGAAYASEDELQAGMQRWEEAGPKLLVTRGGKGISLLQDGRLHTVAAPSVQVVDTTGAGDAFNAAFCVAWAGGLAVSDAAQFAVRAASLSVTRFGAQAGMPTLEELNDL
ncbi:ribokinase [Paenibacillus sp. GCM10023248]|uniref:ribokinase n=1 Tax=Bacillales TaxID=1385 RepID=UPI0023799F52|nr:MULTISPECIES: ribokinase [Bacillales]MDD9268944.1 ribokinase [Paenibacillus sp. MAHUQ-63]MDR6881976.1 ribokinase [Bacillus sp. 3255]